MPQYYNPYAYPVSYAVQQPAYAAPAVMQPQAPMVQQSYATGPNCAMAWVDGEIEARGRQIPPGVTQLALWDTNRQVIYLKSLSPMGMPNPMQILRYTIDEQTGALPVGRDANGNETGGKFDVSGSTDGNIPDMSQYVSKKDFEEMRNELMAAIASINATPNSNTGSGMNTGRNQNGSDSHNFSGRKNGNENRGGNS